MKVVDVLPRRTRWRFSSLLLTLLAVLMIGPFVPEELRGVPSFQLFFSAIFIAGVYSVSGSKRVLIVGATLAVLALLVTWGRETLAASPLLAAADYATDAVFFAYLAAAILRTMLEADEVTGDTVYGGICVYLLLGLLWTTFYSAMEYHTPGSFLLGGTPVSDLSRGATEYRELLYFSFVTLTTLGYGDITPATHPARAISTAGAIVGQLFVAIFIARLVGLHLAHDRGAGEGASGDGM